MRLLECENDGRFHLTDDMHDNQLPPYAILSHTWGQDCDEVTFEDMVNNSGEDKAGRDKIKFCAKQAAQDGLRFFWVDSCCIKKSSDPELSEAINSMFRWYRRAVKCYVYLSDVSTRKRKEMEPLSQKPWEPDFRESRWFTRGWTLQELLAPASVEFFSKEHEWLGDKQSLKVQIHEATEIPISALQGHPLSDFTVRERMSWAAKRNTKRGEDMAYSLLGVFDTHMPLIYGEGIDSARRRLLKEIGEASTKDTESLQIRVNTNSNIPDVSHDLSLSIQKDLLESLRFDQIDDRFMNIKPGHAKTCKWLLGSTEYLDWRSADKLSEHHGFFWIKGKPGSGKSTLTKFTLMEIKRFSRDTTLLRFFFNARGSRLEKNTIGLYRSLLVQLLEKSPISQKVWNLTSFSNRLLNSQLNTNLEMLKQVLAQAIQILGEHSITIVIDALDECDEDEIRDMVAFFEKLGEDAISDGRMLHVLFSSRHYPHITIQRSVEMKLEHQQGHSQDIEKFLSSELKVGRGKQAEQLRQEVRDRSSGIFMWIILVVPILNKALDHGKVHTLQKRLREIPSDLTELFRTILTRDNENLEEMKLCLQCVLFANQPLTREELYYAILSGTEPDDLSSWDPEKISTESMELFILSSSKGLAEVAKSKHQIVQFIHESVRDFLLKENGLGQLWADLVANSIGLSQDRLKECCSNYMKSNIVSDLGIDGDVPSASSRKAGVLRKKASLRFPFLEYAVHNVFAHADMAQAEGVSQELFMKDVELSHWIQLNNIFERYEVRRLPSDIDLLYVCAERNYTNLIGILMQHGLYKRCQNGRYRNPIFAAVAKNYPGAFEALIRADSQMYPDGIEFPYPGDNVGSFLAKHIMSALMPRLISVYNFDNTWTLKSGETMLYLAADQGYTKLVDSLVSKGANVNARGGEYGNVLQAASAEGHEKIVEMLLSHGTDVNAQGGYFGNALQAASTKGYGNIVEMLLNHGADDGVRGRNYGNALHTASAKGYEHIVEMLLNHGADDGPYYLSALQAACVEGYENIVKMLLNHGADDGVRGRNYGNALYVASAKGYEHIVEMLLNHGADDGSYYLSALQAACAGGYENIVEMLLSCGTDVNARGGYYSNALEAASARGHKKIVEMLLNHGADAGAQGGYFGNALQAACAKGYEKIVKMLLHPGADVNAQGGDYGNALYAASVEGHEKIVKILLSYGADVNAQGGYFGNALQAASATGHEKIVNMLVSNGAVNSS